MNEFRLQQATGLIAALTGTILVMIFSLSHNDMTWFGTMSSETEDLICGFGLLALLYAGIALLEVASRKDVLQIAAVTSLVVGGLLFI